VEAGQAEARFWDQTPRTFQAVTEGARRREKSRYELATYEAWQTARLAATANAGKLKRLAFYMNELEPKKGVQSPREMLATLRALASNGVGMTIRKVSEPPSGP